MLCAVLAIAFLSVCPSHARLLSRWMIGWCRLPPSSIMYLVFGDIRFINIFAKGYPQLSLAIRLWVRRSKYTRQRSVTFCGWGAKAGMVRVWVDGKSMWSPCYHKAISERFRHEVHYKALYKLQNANISAFVTAIYSLLNCYLTKWTIHFSVAFYATIIMFRNHFRWAARSEMRFLEIDCTEIHLPPKLLMLSLACYINSSHIQQGYSSKRSRSRLISSVVLWQSHAVIPRLHVLQCFHSLLGFTLWWWWRNCLFYHVLKN